MSREAALDGHARDCGGLIGGVVKHTEGLRVLSRISSLILAGTGRVEFTAGAFICSRWSVTTALPYFANCRVCGFFGLVGRLVRSRACSFRFCGDVRDVFLQTASGQLCSLPDKVPATYAEYVPFPGLQLLKLVHLMLHPPNASTNPAQAGRGPFERRCRERAQSKAARNHDSSRESCGGRAPRTEQELLNASGGEERSPGASWLRGVPMCFRGSSCLPHSTLTIPSCKVVNEVVPAEAYRGAPDTEGPTAAPGGMPAAPWFVPADGWRRPSALIEAGVRSGCRRGCRRGGVLGRPG